MRSQRLIGPSIQTTYELVAAVKRPELLASGWQKGGSTTESLTEVVDFLVRRYGPRVWIDDIAIGENGVVTLTLTEYFCFQSLLMHLFWFPQEVAAFLHGDGMPWLRLGERRMGNIFMTAIKATLEAARRGGSAIDIAAEKLAAG